MRDRRPPQQRKSLVAKSTRVVMGKVAPEQRPARPEYRVQANATVGAHDCFKASADLLRMRIWPLANRPGLCRQLMNLDGTTDAATTVTATRRWWRGRRGPTASTVAAVHPDLLDRSFQVAV